MTHKKDKMKGSTTDSKGEQKPSVVMDLLNKITSKKSARKRDKSRPKSGRKSDSSARDRTPAARNSASRPGSMTALDEARGGRITSVVIRKGSQSNQTPDSRIVKKLTTARGLSNPDIVSKTPPPRSGFRQEVGDENADLDHPRYNRGLSSPDLHHNRSDRQLRRSQNRSCSLEVLRRSHECLKSGGTCKCTIKLYRPLSAMNLGMKTEHGITQEQTRVANGPYRRTSCSTQDTANISDTEVSSFFRPSPTIWEPKNLKNRHQMNSKHPESKNDNLKYTVPNREHELSDGGKLGACASRRSLQSYASSKEADREKENNTIGSSQTGGIINASSETLISSSRPLYTKLPNGEKRIDNRMSTTLHPGNAVSPVIQKQTSSTSGLPPTKPPRTWSAKSVNDVKIADRPIFNASSSIPLRHSQTLCGTSGPQYPASTTYFCADKPGLPPDRDITSYAYRSEEEKAKVLSLLDRYASNNNSNLPLSREQMAAYLSSTKRQLGLAKGLTDNRIPNGERDVHTERLVNGQLDGNMDFRSTNSGYGLSNRISRWNDPEPRRRELGYERRPPRWSNDRVPSIVVFDANRQGQANVGPSPGKGKESTAPLTFSRPSYVRESNRDTSVLPQTTFHMDGAITQSSAIRRRQKDARTVDDDVNNNGDVTTAAGESGSPRRGGCHVLSHFAVPSCRLWRRKTNNSALEASLSEILPQEEMLGEQHQDISRHLNDGIRYCQSLDRLSSWLYGSSMMIIFVFLLLIGFLATFGINHVMQTSAWLSFTLAVITMTSATFVLERRRRKVKEKLRVTMMMVNSLLSEYNALCTVVDGRSCKQGTTFYFVHFDTWPCQDRLSSLISEKTCEDHLLTEISRKYPNLFDVTTQNLREIIEKPEDTGKKVISRDVLIYFAAAFVEDFLLHKKSYTKGRQQEIGRRLHDKRCLCNFVMNKVLTGAFVKDNQSTTHLKRKAKSSPTSRPTIL